MNSLHTPYFNLLEIMRLPGCALCTLSELAITRFLENMLYEYVNDAGVQQMLVDAHGFCATHSRLLAGYHSALGITILYKAILNHLQEELTQEQPVDNNWLSRLTGTRDNNHLPLTAHAPCPACKIRDDAAARALDVWHEHHDETDLAAAWQASDGLCLPHLRQALGRLDGPARHQLLTHQHQVWQKMQAQLDEFIRKSDYRFQHEGFTQEEGNIWQRTIYATSGKPGVF